MGAVFNIANFNGAGDGTIVGNFNSSLKKFFGVIDSEGVGGGKSVKDG